MLNSAGIDVAGTQNDLTFDADTPIAARANGRPDCTVNPAIHKDGASFVFLPRGCDPMLTCTGVRALIVALDNAEPIPNDAELYSCQVRIAQDAARGAHPLLIAAVAASDQLGHLLPARGTDGLVEVLAGCSGDCNGDGEVTVNELVVMVNIALGNAQVSACTAGDADGSGSITINEIIAGVNNALSGCPVCDPCGSATPTVSSTPPPASTATHTPTPSPTQTPSSCVNLTGDWAGTYAGGLSGTWTASLQQLGGALSGTITVRDATYGLLPSDAMGSVGCPDVTINFLSGTATLSGSVTGNCMSGTWSASSLGASGAWTGCRAD